MKALCADKAQIHLLVGVAQTIGHSAFLWFPPLKEQSPLKTEWPETPATKTKLLQYFGHGLAKNESENQDMSKQSKGVNARVEGFATAPRLDIFRCQSFMSQGSCQHVGLCQSTPCWNQRFTRRVEDEQGNEVPGSLSCWTHERTSNPIQAAGCCKTSI